MNSIFKIKFFTILLLCLVGSTNFSKNDSLLERNPSYDLIKVEKKSPPSEEVMKAWRENFFASDEFWIVRNINEFSEFLRIAEIGEPYYGLITNQFDNELASVAADLVSFYNFKLNKHPLGGFIIIPELLKEIIPAEYLKIIYSYLYSKGDGPPSIRYRFEDDLKNTILSWNIPKDIKEQFIERIVHVYGEYILPISKYDWSYIPDDVKNRLIKKYINPDELPRVGLKLELHIKSEEDVLAAAKKYSNGTNEIEIQNILRNRLKQSETGQAIVPFEDILPPFVRETLDLFNPSTGPNCHNASDCFNRGDDFKIGFTSPEKMTTILKRDYVKPNHFEELRTGDLIHYRDMYGNPIHTVVYIDDETVFTKNGMTKFSPYLFQYTSDVENIYFPEGNSIIEWYRFKDFTDSKKINCNTGMKDILLSGKSIN